ncbi:hypothetical protein [Streptomyces olindensis]|uniref:hypothetical protein n=1 Tax=Streptomyces olindensis TaxID=358823 RepID=UPI0033C528B3
MAHVQPAHLVELALGNAAPGRELTGVLPHIEECDRCRDELRTMIRVVTAARGARLGDLPTAPPERVWRRIARELAHDPRTCRPHTGGTAPRPRRSPRHRRPKPG